MSRCLVTGHRGYIGSKVYKQLKEAGYEVIGIDLVDGHDILDCFSPRPVAYIDDKSVAFSNWKNALKSLEDR